MKLRKTLCVIMATGLLITMVGCGIGSDSENKNRKLKIGVLQYVQHQALDSAREGFVEVLKENGYEDGKNIEIDYQNAQGDASNPATIADTFVNDKKDLILAIATPAAQAIAQKTKDIPILVTAVTDPADAGLVKSNDDVRGNVSGTSDLSPVKEQIDMAKKIKPNAKKIGIMYCSAEDNSKLLVKLATEEAAKEGLEVVNGTVQNSNDVQSVIESLVSKVDVIYAPTDNIISSSMGTIATVAKNNKIPLIVGEKEQVENGGLVTKGIDYKELGKLTGKMAVKVLKGEKKISDMPIEYLKNFTFAVNKETQKAIGIEDLEKLVK